MVFTNPGWTRANPDLSVVAPLYNEAENVRPLVEWILQALDTYPGAFEVILVDDGSRDDTWSEVRGGGRGSEFWDFDWAAMSDRPQP